jgi:hypothetical protein
MRLILGRFEKWLKAKPPTEIVGENRDCHSCPIANYYSEVAGNDIVIYQDGNTGEHIGDRGYYKKTLPYWASRFVSTVDGDANGQITAGRALAVLAECR